MKVKLKERYFLEFYMNRLVDELYNHHKSWSSIDVGESRIVEDVSIPSEIASIVEDTSIDSCPFKIASVIQNTSIDSCLSLSSLDEVHVSLGDSLIYP